MKRVLKGFTLIEIIAVVAIVGIIVVALYSFFINNFKVVQEEAKIAQIESQAKRLEDTIKQWLQMADQQNILVYPLSKRIDMIVYEDNSAVSGIAISITFEPSTKGIRITKNGNITSFLDGKIINFDVEDVTPQIKIQYTVDLGIRGKTRTYKIVYTRRYDW
ncbi:prepilin-type N-terminal cleavage/methylation domain-containing protein [Anaerocellum diazotrophicum]|uniref:Prepilin-type N-terminal cleavage/methylation domain-containing protein n=1 Tax=Caldicellulosiruptor diazotrophicus TaxID=2806205 RepID=A0ABM7NKT6_9FIRM|nr:prepilin-type N-terminal cleavage/methylation domain-containing protein [Caldicellulosiruptor diazotrophicus]BCS80723.1 hypothetical protein CaldiYA01_06830 [Caldicellulosiruptor diazotrophicus]